MSKVELKYIQRFRDRHGKLHCYFRKPGSKRIRLPGPPGSHEFMSAYANALSKSKSARSVGAERTKPGTLNALLVEYYNSHYFADLKASTQANYRNILERLRNIYGNDLIADLTKLDVETLLDERKAVPSAKRNFFKRFRKLLDFAVDRSYITVNPARTIKTPKVPAGGFPAWSDDDIAVFEAHYKPGSKQRLALALLLYTGQRRSDVVEMGWQHVKADTIYVLQEKTELHRARTRLAIPMHPKLKAALADRPRDDLTFLMTAFGRPRTKAGFSQWFTDCAKKAGLQHRTPHGLRKAAARKLAEAGCSAHQIAAITGHKSLSEVQLYTQSVRQEHLAQAAMKAWSENDG